VRFGTDRDAIREWDAQAEQQAREQSRDQESSPVAP
jgi:hypothetical protein